MTNIKALITTITLTIAPLTYATPTLNKVTSGDATIIQNAGNTTINQTTNNATIDWRSFNIRQNQTVVFNQPSAQSLTINTIQAATPTTIHGSISANGRIVLLNPNGFYFSSTSSVSAHTFIAAAATNNNTIYNSSTNSLSIINNDVINGGITAHGTITAHTTQLIAKRIVTNTTINTTGTIAITATKHTTLHGTFTGTGITNIDIFSGGTIRGSANTTATNTTINATGELSLSGTHTATGTLALSGNPLFLESTVTLNAGTLTINSPHSFALISATIGAHTHTYTANTSLTFIGANLNSTAGSIIIGNQTTPTITINPTTTIANNATTSTTNAGSIIIFSKDHTQFYGTATATAEQGNGGLIELSSIGTITYASPFTISTTATHGNTGTLLIDPKNILIAGQSAFNTFNTFRELLQVNPNVLQAGDKQGYSVTLTATHALVGAYNFDHQETAGSGNAFLYNLTDDSWVNLLTTADAPTAYANARFGSSVALSSTHALIGTSGNAFLYTISSGTWTKLLATEKPLLLLTPRLEPGNGQSYIVPPTNPAKESPDAPTAQANARFGSSVALSATYALIGASGYDHSSTTPNSGNAFLYEISSGTWTNLLATSDAPSAQANAHFGTSVALSATHALIGASGYDHSSTTPNSGNAFLYQLSDSAWTNLLTTADAPSAQANAHFGASVALSSSHALIGALLHNSPRVDRTGNAYLYNLSNSTWTDLLATTNAPTLQANANFGTSVALSATHALIGAITNDHQSTTRSGKGFLYNISTGTWNTLLANKSAPANKGLSLQPSISVALSSTHALIGTHTNNYGNAYLFSFLPRSDITYDVMADPTTFPALLENNNVTLTATNSITVLSSIDLSSYTGSNTLTLNAPTVNFSFSNAGSVVGSANNIVIVTTPSRYWTSTDQYILNSIVFASITHTVGDILPNNDITAPYLILSIKIIDGIFDLGTNTITVASLTTSDNNTEEE